MCRFRIRLAIDRSATTAFGVLFLLVDPVVVAKAAVASVSVAHGALCTVEVHT